MIKCCLHHRVSAILKQKLQIDKIIEAQVKGGCHNAEFVLVEGDYKLRDGFLWSDDDSISVLDSLLDTHGCKAIWGEGGNSISHAILDAWNFGDGNNYLAAIETAFMFLNND